jgi:hypothetical protein
MISAIFAAAVLLADVTPPAGEAATAQAPTAAPAAKTKEKSKDALVCHTDANLGTRLPKKVCVRAADADQQRQQDRAAIERAQSQARPPN